MRSVDVLAIGSRNLLRRKTRTLLTVVGVVVGAAAIVIMISLGLGMNASLERTIANMGDLTIIELRSQTGREGADGMWETIENRLDAAVLREIREMDGVVAATPVIELWQGFTLQAGRRFEAQWGNLIGIDMSFLPYLNLELDRGTMPTAGDRSFILFGADTIYNFHDPNRPPRRQSDLFYPDGTRRAPRVDVATADLTMRGVSTGMWDQDAGEWREGNPNFRFHRHTFDSVGIMQADPMNWMTQWAMIVDIRIIEEMQAEIERAHRVPARNSRVGLYNEIRIKTADIQSAERVQEQLLDMGLTIGWSLHGMRSEMQASQSMTQMILGGIGAMSLIVAAVGIANTMFMSIYERTKEIGIMKVLGCPLRGIKSMFLFEASMIGFLGGLLGIGLSLLGSYLMNNVEAVSQALGNIGGTGGFHNSFDDAANNVSIIPMWLMGAAILFSTIIGLISGYLPARRATKISALEAIRNE